MRSKVIWASVVLAGLSMDACASEGDDERLGGESHWFAACSSDADCSDGHCLCGVCTAPCFSDATCDGPRESACVDAATNAALGSCAGLPRGGAICLAVCESDGECGSELRCRGGSCLPSSLGAPDASVSDGGMSDDAAPPPTAAPLRGLPPPPLAGTFESGGSIHFTSALYSVDYGDRDPDLDQGANDYLEIGFDLDEACTEHGAAECTLPEWASGTRDGPECQDNAFGDVVHRLRQNLSGASSERRSELLQAGEVHTALIRVRDYNGQINDDQVRVELFVGLPLRQGSEAPGPTWDGSDIWTIDESSVTDEGAARFEDPAAYVSASQLVVTLPRARWPLTIRDRSIMGGYWVLALERAFIVCNIEENDGMYQLSACTLGGRLPSDTLVRDLWRLQDPRSLSEDAFLCTNTSLYPRLKESICWLTDSASVPGPVSSPCDALSLGVAFDTRPALLGDVAAAAPPASTCPPSTDPTFDSCSIPIQPIIGDAG
jgi:hypothetical protein